MPKPIYKTTIPISINKSDNDNRPLYVLSISEFEPIFKTWIKDVLQSESPKIQEDKLLTREEVCKLLNVSYPTLTSYQKKGLLSGKRVGHRILYSQKDIENALK